jgi:hypothetical protein
MSDNTTPPPPTPQMTALSIFCSLYAPATQQSFTDTFSSLEIVRMVEKHTGIDLILNELHEMMQQMQYQYLVVDDAFVWMVRKEAEA